MPGRFVVKLTPRFQRDLEALPSVAQEKILDAIKRLETNPFGPSPRTKKLKVDQPGIAVVSDDSAN